MILYIHDYATSICKAILTKTQSLPNGFEAANDHIVNFQIEKATLQGAGGCHRVTANKKLGLSNSVACQSLNTTKSHSEFGRLFTTKR